jgi:hypothetical protein
MTMRPDPTFHASPKLAMEAPAESFAYTLLLSPNFSKPDAVANWIEFSEATTDQIRTGDQPTSSAVASKLAGTVSPSALAVLLIE